MGEPLLRRPAGQLSVRVAVMWLANCTPEDDALTEMSRLSLGRSLPSSGGDDPVSARAAAILHDLDQVRCILAGSGA